MNIFTQPFSAETPCGMQGGSSESNQFVFQSSSASISNMIAVAHQDANLPTEMSENATSANNLTQAMMMMGGEQMFNGGDGMFADVTY